MKEKRGRGGVCEEKRIDALLFFFPDRRAEGGGEKREGERGKRRRILIAYLHSMSQRATIFWLEKGGKEKDQRRR